MKRFAVLCLSLLIFFFLFGTVITGPAFSQQQGAEEVLVKIGDKAITKEAIEWRIQGLPAEHQGQFKSDEQKRDFLKKLVQNDLLAREAREVKLDREKGVEAAIEDFVNFYLAQTYIKYAIARQITISKEDTEKYYAAHKDDFKAAPTVKIQHILVSVPADAAFRNETAALKKAKMIRKELAAGADFAKLAQKYSDDQQTRESGGELDYLRRESINPDIGDAAFRLKIGEISAPVRTIMGYHLVKVLDRKDGKQMDLEEATPQIQSTLFNQRQQEAVAGEIERLNKKYNVVYKP